MDSRSKEFNIVTQKLSTSTSQKVPMFATTNSSSWSDFVPVLLCDVLSRLSSIDRIRFRAVCRNWRLPLYPKNDLPWVVGYSCWRTSATLKFKFTLFEPWQQTPYAVDELTSQAINTKDVRVLASKNGWLFLMLKQITLELENPKLFFVLFSPFTKRVIKLPDLMIKTYPLICKGTFSTDPISSDCVFFVVLKDFNLKNKTTLCVCKPDYCDKAKWTTRTIYGVSIDDVEFIGGAFHGVASNGNLITYRPENDLYTLDRLEPRPFQGKKMRFSSLVDYGGDILNVTYDFSSIRRMYFQVNIFDQLTMSWVGKEKFHNFALFLDSSTSFIIPATGDRSHMANKIFYYKSGWEVHYYSFDDYKSHIYVNDKPICGWLSEKKHNATWLRPPQSPR